MSSELVSGSLLLLQNESLYAAAALIRQLIECEYLLRAFHRDFADAALWVTANDAERWNFKPSKLRKVGGFDQQEYGNHCIAGGHPHPAGRGLLRLERNIRAVGMATGQTGASLDAMRLMWLDFAMHCDRVWFALVELLTSEHARFTVVQEEAVSAVQRARVEWGDADVLAGHLGEVLAKLDEHPDAPLETLFESNGDPAAEPG